MRSLVDAYSKSVVSSHSMTYTEAHQYLLSLENLPRKEYLRDPKACELYLKRLQFFLDILGNPERRIPHYIHVTGTSGKGSVCSFLHSILNAAGKKVGSITSPHPTYLYERWQIGNRTMTQKEFVVLVEKIRPLLDQYVRTSPYDMISFSELMTAIGLLYLAQKKVEWAVVEVGLGGRYDATNVLPWKDAAVITNIGLDHTEILGNTKEKIAYEKAGIIKSGARVFTMDNNPKVLRVIAKECEKTKTTLVQVKGTKIKDQGLSNSFSYHNQSFNLTALGKHQINNAILCINIAESIDISITAIKKGIENTIQPIRMEIVSQNPTIILDGAHNPDKIKTTVETLTMRQKGSLHLVLGFSGDKDARALIKQLVALKPASIACTRNTINPFRKVADPKFIQTYMQRLVPGAKTELFLDPEDALAWSKQQAEKKDTVLVTGSIFLSGQLREQYIRT